MPPTSRSLITFIPDISTLTISPTGALSRSPMGMDGVDRQHSEGKGQQRHVVGVELQRTPPEVGANAFLIEHVLPVINAADEDGGQEDESLGRRDKAEGLINVVA